MENKRKTICLLNDSFPPLIDGVSNAVLNYAKIIEEKRGHSMVVTPNVPGAKDDYPFPVYRYPSIDTRSIMGYVAGYPFSPEAAHAVKTEGVDVLHTHCPATSALLARQLSESMDLPLVLTWHTKFDIDIANAVKNSLLREGALQAFLRNVDACDEVWTVSEGAGENLRSLGFEGDYVVMPNGVDLPRARVSEDFVREVTSEYDLPEDVPCYLFIGRMMWYKGVRIILDALDMLKAEGKDFRMVFIGAGYEGDEIRKYAEEIGLSDKVFFTGAVSDRDKLRAWYQRADLFLFPSTYDTNGLVVREAAASDTAAVIVRGSCAAEGVTDGRNGFMIEENAESLAAKLRELSRNPEIMKTVGRAAGDEIYISWEDAVAAACERYEIVIDKYKRGEYKKREPIVGAWMQAQGELMQLLGNIGAAGKVLRRKTDEIQKGVNRSIKNAKDQMLEEIVAAGNGVSNNISDVVQDIWEFLDRYQ